MYKSVFIAAFLLLISASIHAQTPIKIGEYGQELSRQYTTANGLPSNEAIQLVAGDDGSILAETSAGWARFEDGVWSTQKPDSAPASRATLMSQAKDLLLDYLANMPSDTPEPQVHDIQTKHGKLYLIASSAGLYSVGESGELLPRYTDDTQGHRWGAINVLTAYQGIEWYWICTSAGAVHQEQIDNEAPLVFTAREGLPFNEFTSMDQESSGYYWPWFGTSKGVIQLRRNGDFAYRQGPRWLPDDHVNDILAMSDGSAWVATKGGVAHIYFEPMTLAEKAEHYEEQIEKYIKRTEYEYVAEITTDKPGDLSVIHHHDSDNDGLWTSMYGAGECFAYAATKDPRAKERAKQAFEALRFLQKVTQGGEHSPPKGYVARTILPTTDRDPNIGRIEGDREEQKGDALWKVYEPRWPKSADGKWYWKSDTSSDELDGHYFFYPAYYDLVADTPEEKERVREVVRDLTDHFLEHNFQLIDHDGKVTRWGEFSPEALNGDRRWYVERGLNSLSMLSYLAVAEHMTGYKKYAEASRMLIEQHHYDQNAMVPKIQFGIGSGNQSDDEMAFMSFYNLIKYTKNDELRERMRHSFFGYWKLEFPELNPFFNFAAAASLNGTVSNTHWGPVDLTLFDGWLEDSIATLKGFPLDRFNWPVQNSHRLDIVPLYRHQAVDIDDREPPRRGLRVNGKVLPVEERHFNHWNTDPYRLDYGGDGRMLASGTVFLLPYYMGLYHGFIE